MLAPPAWKKFFDANLIQNIFNSIFILELLFQEPEYRNYISVQIQNQIIIKVFGSRSWSVSTIRIELLNLESKPERDLKQIIIKVFGSRSWSVSKIRIELFNLESKPERDLKQIILKVFGSRSWSISENKLMF